jgi:hypothetical protein
MVETGWWFIVITSSALISALFVFSAESVALFASGLAIDDIRRHLRNPRRRNP